ncbi:MAG: hypothetical protein MUF16_25585 [Burkholderiaceae bacterium]|nr:hypothetical protein [Burkholderiaceae bacterium]
MSDEKTASRLIEHEELRDIHRRIDSLKEEGERNHKELASQLHNLEVAVARGSRFPATGWVAAVGLALTVVGTGAALYGQLLVTTKLAQEAKEAIQTHIVEMGPAESEVWRMSERVKALEGRVVGQGPDGWHRRDHDLYAAMMDERNNRIRDRLEVIEAQQAALCQRVAACKGQR